ncbi:MAG: DUF4199 domain-containing protein [Chitinophagaceae bacterium]|nr:DUF4199 domain-containing protein [Chitinophagaceae bacterium]
MTKITPLLKGIITGIAMLVVTLVLFYTKQKPDSGLQYIIFAIYAGGIAWTLLVYFRSPEYTGRFGDIFSQGFKCFIIVTLVIVAFTGIFSAMHPEFADEDAKLYREYLVQQKNNTPQQIDEMVKDERDNYATKNMWRAAFGTLIPGAIFTAAGAGLLVLRKK